MTVLVNVFDLHTGVLAGTFTYTTQGRTIREVREELRQMLDEDNFDSDVVHGRPCAACAQVTGGEPVMWTPFLVTRE
jgi:hypothetical protein